MKKFFWRFCAFMTTFLSYSSLAMAATDPATQASKKMSDILFGTFGTSLSAILIGGTFVLAYVGKITWDRFVFIGFCAAGFLGSKTIVSVIHSWVS